jgi:hypothetical protein
MISEMIEEVHKDERNLIEVENKGYSRYHQLNEYKFICKFAAGTS